jgi:hypothetical protein
MDYKFENREASASPIAISENNHSNEIEEHIISSNRFRDGSQGIASYKEFKEGGKYEDLSSIMTLNK